MAILKNKIKDNLLTTGFILILISLFIFSVPFLFNYSSESYLGLFVLNFFFSATYFIVLQVNKKSRQEEHKRHYVFLLLILFLISAYSLNRDMVVFATSPVWICVVLIILCVNYLLSIFFKNMPKWLQYVVFFLLGIAVAFFLYLSFYLLPLYLVSIAALIALGISIHSFIPLLFTIYTISLASYLAKDIKSYWWSFAAGVLSVLIACICYVAIWNSDVKIINRSYARALSEGGDDLPAWIQVAQQINQTSITEKILKTGLVYTSPNRESDLLWRMPSRSFGEEQQVHDPLVTMASLFSEQPVLNQDDKINILKSQFSSRHQAEEKLWSGKDLRTQQVISTIKIWPDIHIAYTEKIITVFNHSSPKWFRDQQEALYTFQLPEGGVVTALSLWINGKEEKGILTTKEKAATAYNKIVGVEVRDPSVVHWQEGNRVTVRVFPVLAGANRIFKIGITAPLRSEDNKLAYDNISFEGPDASSAQETTRLSFTRPVKEIIHQASFRPEKSQAFVRSGNYQSQWSFYLRDEGLSPRVFSFAGHHYFLKPYQPQRTHITIRNVYLDLNESWTKKEFGAAWKHLQDKNVWVYNNGFIRVTEDNKDEIFDELQQYRFSLFPVQKIKDTEHSLLLTKTGHSTPNLSDLKESGFFASLKNYAVAEKKIKLFNLGQRLSPYLASLKEYRFFDYENGGLRDLEQVLDTNTFAASSENENEITIHNAGLSIVKGEGEIKSSGPDHLMRLFAYNDIMRRLGQKGLSDSLNNTDLVKEAEAAYVVSPVSSLIVLETQQDYDRFDINNSEKSLKNASAKSNGAVPEPHEWVLIVLAAGIAFFLFIKTRM